VRFDTSAIGAVYGNEMRHLLRDRRTIVMSIVLPLLVMPIMLFGSRWMEKRREAKLDDTTFAYAVTGSQASSVREAIAAAETISKGRGEEFRFREESVDDAGKALEEGKIHLFVEGMSAAEGRTLRDEQNGEAGAEEPQEGAQSSGDADVGEEQAEPLLEGVKVVVLTFRADRDVSERAVRRLRELLRESRWQERNLLLRAHGFPVDANEVAAATAADVATAGQVAGLTLGRLLTALLLLFMLSGGAVVATDALAGEKERGTLETLLTCGVSRLDIVAAKHLAILTVALLITVIQVGNLLLYVGFKLIPAPQNFAAAVPPHVAALLFVLYLPLAALVAGVLLLTSGYAKSYKEAQLIFFPVFMIGMLPALAPLLPGVSLRSAIVLVPIANLAVATKEVLTGVFDWPMLLVAWLVTAAAAVWTGWQALRTLSSERLIVPTVGDAERTSPAVQFERKVLRNFALMWAVLLVVSANAGPNVDIRMQIVINLGVLFLGGSLVMVRVYKLSPREVFALRPVRPVVWLAVVLGAPAGLLTGLGVFRIANLVIPVPPKMLEGFGQSLLPDELPFAQVVAFLCIAPGIIEELAFRGVLLHGLRRRFRPWVLALVVGGVFGLFHTALFRIIPTGFLGVMFAAVTLLTGSIFPAMLWHTLNNLASLAAARLEIPLGDLDPGLYLAGAAILAACFWIVWRNRTPYPGLRVRGAGRREG